MDFQTEYGSQQLFASGISRFTNSISEKNLRVIRQENLNRIVIAHLNINSIMNRFDLLANQIIRNIYVLVISKAKLNVSLSNLKFRVSRLSHRDIMLVVNNTL